MFVTLPAGNRVFYDVLGNAEPTMVLIHGSDVDHTFLRPWVDPLAYAATLVLVDLPGFGRSDAGSASDWNLTSWANAVAELCDALELHPIVCGFSLGGRVAMRLATTRPDCAAGLVLANATGVTRPDRTAAMYRWLGGDAAGDAYERDYADPNEETMQEWFRLCQPLTVKRPYAADEFVNMVPPAPGVNEQLAKVRNKPENLLPELGVIACPTLVITGADDPMATPEDAADIAAAIGSNATLAIVENSGHGVFRDNPDAFVRATTEFILRTK